MDPYKVLTEVVKERSFTKAAENLYTSQPSVSRDIKRLENKYEIKVFEFNHSKMSLTNDGKKLFRYALQRAQMEAELWHDLKEEHNKVAGELTIGSSYTYGEYKLSQHLTDLVTCYPDLRINVRLDNSETMIENIKNNTIDLGIVEKEIQDHMINTSRIAKDEMVLIRRNINVSNEDRCFIRERGSGTRVYQEIGLSQLKLNPYLVEINNTTLIKHMVHAGNGFAIVSKSTLTPTDYKILDITPLNIERYFYLLTHKNKYIDTNLKILIENLEHS
ncbi:LysR substrate-binding domain-containing protein [Staphylococcus sp. ACRSN]|uniref:LysR substrate-binding domain-containing protein n=1 Tax=Staphylococcus sp. ACRSN TaxID=2918214 RepID=UPI001EF1FDA1|nr:LysR substrate-binding domain-containing protein [Staphylococcus sp. ACRSN]MCG7338939.1 LysR substrate-binding domain-containing protein [Staphylococcus sp. ACRSN]